MKHASLGTISHGTLRADDLIEAFAGELEYQVQRNADAWCDENSRLTRDECMKIIWDAREASDDEEKEFALEALVFALDRFAAPYCYFGAHEADGSDYGFWVSHSTIDQTIRDGEALSVSDLADIPGDYSGDVFVVNDHGNVTFYYVTPDGRCIEQWAIV